MREIGHIVQLQVQLDRLKKGTRPKQHYDPAALRVVPTLRLTTKGVIGLVNGQELFDIHHADHEYSKHRSGNGISFNFSAHYDRMRDHFGRHLEIGCAGENILIATDEVLEWATLSEGLVIKADGGTLGCLTQIQVAHPCIPFSTYALNLDSPPSTEIAKKTLQFLDGGTRGFYCEWTGEPAVVCVDDRVFVDD